MEARLKKFLPQSFNNSCPIWNGHFIWYTSNIKRVVWLSMHWIVIWNVIHKAISIYLTLTHMLIRKTRYKFRSNDANDAGMGGVGILCK